MNRLKKIGVMTVVSAAALAGGGYAIAASGNSAGTATGGTAGAITERMPKFDPQAAQKERDSFYAALGAKLGKSKDEVKAAFRGLLSDRLDADVKAGRLTEQQKQAILAGFDSGLPGPGMGLEGGPGHGPGMGFGGHGPDGPPGIAFHGRDGGGPGPIGMAVPAPPQG